MEINGPNLLPISDEVPRGRAFTCELLRPAVTGILDQDADLLPCLQLEALDMGHEMLRQDVVGIDV
jgi:hypothetical protein